MRLSSSVKNDAEKGERKDFAKTRSMVEGIKRTAAVAALALGMSLYGCGGDGPTSDGGPTGDGGSMTDGGTSGDGGSGGDGGGMSLCSVHPEGSPNRVTFGVQDNNNIQNPADNTENRRMFLRKIENIGGTDYATFGVYDQDTPATAPTYTGVPNGGSRVINISGTVGNLTVQICQMTVSACSVGTPGSTPMGDVNCTVTVCADRPWGVP